MPINDNSKRLLLLRLGEAIHGYSSLKDPEPYQSPKNTPPPEKLLKDIKDYSIRLQSYIGMNRSRTFTHLRKALGLRGKQLPGEIYIQAIALCAYCDLATLREGHTPDSLVHQLSPLLSDDPLEGKMAARPIIATLLEKGVFILSDRIVHLTRSLQVWLTGGNFLCVPCLTENLVRWHLSRKQAAVEARKKKPPSTPPIASPLDLYNRLKEIVIGQDEACKVLATRGWLHLKRAEQLKAGQNVGANECIFFISQCSGVGKTFLAENFGRLCSLPYSSFSSESATSVGFVGSDLVEDSLKSLIRAAGNPQEPATIERARLGGIIFYDEFTKKRSLPLPDGRDISGAAVQQEILRVMEGCKVQLGNRRFERDGFTAELDTTGVMFLFGGYVDGFDSVIRKLHRKGNGLGFSGEDRQETKFRDAYLYDAMVDYGFIPEFVNRLSKIVLFRKLTPMDLVEIASTPAGVIASYNRLLAPQGLTFRIVPQGIKLMADLSVDTGMMARGLRLIVSSLVEDAVFNAAKGEILFGLKEVRQAIEQVSSVGRIEEG